MSQIVLRVDPLGDSVVATAVARKLHYQKLQASLLTKPHWEPILRETGISIYTDRQQLPTDIVEVDVCQYLLQPGTCHRAKIPMEYWYGELNPDGIGHLVSWMGMYIEQSLKSAGIQLTEPLAMSNVEVNLPVNKTQLEKGWEWLRENLLQFHRLESQPLVLLCPAAGSPNRNIPPNVLTSVVSRLNEQAVFVLLQPLPKDFPGYEEIPCEILPMIPQDLLAPVLLIANAFVGADTGPTHVAAAVRQCPANRELVQSRNVRASEVVWLCGSSHPKTLAYPANLWVRVPQYVCPIAPCGHHGYTPVPDSERDWDGGDTPVFKVGNTGCVDDLYTQSPHIAPCMASLEVKEIIRMIRLAIT